MSGQAAARAAGERRAAAPEQFFLFKILAAKIYDRTPTRWYTGTASRHGSGVAVTNIQCDYNHKAAHHHQHASVAACSISRTGRPAGPVSRGAGARHDRPA